MPEKLISVIGMVGLLAMTKPNSVENINWRAFGLLIAILIPLMGGLFGMGVMMGNLSDIPDELKTILLEMKEMRLEVSGIKEDVAVLKAKSE